MSERIAPYRPSTALGWLLHRARQTTPICRQGAEEAASAQVGLTLGLSVIGRLMTFSEVVRELNPQELASLGDLFWSLNEAIHQLGEMERGWTQPSDTKEMSHV